MSLDVGHVKDKWLLPEVVFFKYNVLSAHSLMVMTIENWL